MFKVLTPHVHTPRRAFDSTVRCYSFNQVHMHHASGLSGSGLRSVATEHKVWLHDTKFGPAKQIEGLQFRPYDTNLDARHKIQVLRKQPINQCFMYICETLENGK
jgi:hypothetical protein